MRRRSLIGALATGATFGIAGCSGPSGTGEPTSSGPTFERAATGYAQGERIAEAGRGETTVTTDVELPEGTYDYAAWAPSMSVSVSYELQFDRYPGEFIVIDQDQLEAYQEQAEISHYTDYHGTGQSSSAGGWLPAGEYYLIVDNTTFGKQDPEGDLSGELTFTVET